MNQREQPNRTIDQLGLRLTDVVLARPWTTIVVCFLFVFAAAAGIPNVVLDTNYRVFFGPDNPELLAFDQFEANYTQNDNIVFTVKPNSGDVFTPETLSAIEQMTKDAWQIPYVIRVDSITNFQHSWADGDDLTVDDLIRNGAALTPSQLDEKASVALAEPLLAGRLLALDKEATGVNVTLQFPDINANEVLNAGAAARALAATIESTYPHLKVALSGTSMVNLAFNEAGTADAMTLIPGMYVILALAMFLVLRSLSGTIATLLIIISSSLFAVGIINGHLRVGLGPISVTAPIIIMTLSVADSIHIIVSILVLMRTGLDKVSAIRESMRRNFLAVTVTSLTTIIGFLSLNYSDSPPMKGLGNVTALGIFGAWLLSITLLPALLRLFPIREKAHRTFERSEAMMVGLSRFVIHRYKLLLGLAAVASIAAATVLPRIEFNDQWIEYFDHSIQFRRDSEFQIKHLSGIFTVEYSVEADQPGGISDPEYLQNLESFVQWLRRQPEVQHVFSYTDILKRLNKNMHGDDTAWYRLPTDRKLAAQYLFLYEISLPFGLDLNDRVTVDRSATRVSATLDNITSAETRALLDRVSGWLKANLPAHMWAQPTSPGVMFSYISLRNVQSMFTGNAMALILISLTLMVSLASARLGALSIIPNLLPIVVTFGIWAILVGRVGLAASVITASSLGIIVDNTVHFLAKFLRAQREHASAPAEAIEYAFRTGGTAILANTIILVAGFFLLAFSSFKITQEMGLLTGIAIIVALAFDFFLLPALLMIGGKPPSISSSLKEPAYAR